MNKLKQIQEKEAQELEIRGRKQELIRKKAEE